MTRPPMDVWLWNSLQKIKNEAASWVLQLTGSTATGFTSAKSPSLSKLIGFSQTRTYSDSSRCQRTGMCVLHICSRTRVYMLPSLFVDITALGGTGAWAQQTGRIKVIPAILAERLSTESKRGGGNRLVKQLMMEKLILSLQIWGLHLLPQSLNPLSDKSN